MYGFVVYYTHCKCIYQYSTYSTYPDLDSPQWYEHSLKNAVCLTMLRTGCSVTLFCLKTLAMEMVPSAAKFWVFIELVKKDTCVLSLCCVESTRQRRDERVSNLWESNEVMANGEEISPLTSASSSPPGKCTITESMINWQLVYK